MVFFLVINEAVNQQHKLYCFKNNAFPFLVFLKINPV